MRPFHFCAKYAWKIPKNSFFWIICLSLTRFEIFLLWSIHKYRWLNISILLPQMLSLIVHLIYSLSISFIYFFSSFFHFLFLRFILFAQKMDCIVSNNLHNQPCMTICKILREIISLSNDFLCFEFSNFALWCKFGYFICAYSRYIITRIVSWSHSVYFVLFFEDLQAHQFL